jgi:glycosyltransferase involved in cell wall biosynthesis
VTRWAILTGEYPPQPGGVSDYTAAVARGLAEAGDHVGVWAPLKARNGTSAATDGADTGLAAPDGVGGIAVRRLPGGYGPSGLAVLDREMDRFRPDRILVQYVPHAFGLKAMNVPFCGWLRSRRADGVWVMFHEVAFPWGRDLPWRHNLLGAVTRVMARLAADAAERILVSTPAWARLLATLGVPERRAEWLPIPSNMPEPPPGAGEAVRRRLGWPADTPVIGHFGTFGELVTRHLDPALAATLEADPTRVALLVGRGGERHAEALAGRHPSLADRIRAAGALEPADVAAHLSACDVMLQPYADGISGRRTSAMAALACGRAVVTNSGAATEPVWREAGGVEIAGDGEPGPLAAAVGRLLADRAAREGLAERGRTMYRRDFSAARTISALRRAGPQFEGMR